MDSEKDKDSSSIKDEPERKHDSSDEELAGNLAARTAGRTTGGTSVVEGERRGMEAGACLASGDGTRELGS